MMLVKNMFQILIAANILGLLYLVFYPLPHHDNKPHPYGLPGNQIQKRLWQNVHGLGHAHNISGWNAKHHLNDTYRGMKLHPIGVKAPSYKANSKSMRQVPLYTNISQICVNLSLASTESGFVNFIRDIRRRNIAPDDEFLRLTENCTEFRSLRAYHSNALSSEEAEFPVAYGIYIYRSAHQVEQLLRSIYMPHNYYCLHVDRKSPKLLHDAIRAIGQCFNNVFVIPDPSVIVYRSIGLLHAEMKCLELLSKKGRWKYYINLSGQEYPLRTNLEIVRSLNALDGKNDVSSIPNVVPYRQEFVHVIENGVLVKTDETRSSIPPANISLYYGEAHVILSRDFVDFVLTDEKAGILLSWLKGSDTPEEHFYSTLNRLPQAPGGETRDSMSMARAKMWDDGTSDRSGNIRCHGKYIHDICILTTADLPWLLRQPFLFANKFHVTYDPLVIDCLQEIIGHRSLHDSPVDVKIYSEYRHTPSIGNCLDVNDVSFNPNSLFRITRCALEYANSHFPNIMEQMMKYSRHL
ncbi:N-acetyllactosaminide beta-1,6-N-acetylglucosaminyl-transferase-like [Ptychodera flava]|uniref:N-acetyllactosaminide beta-1,6-N-acetylglucosaminyl-transferase-like n=1 Tax=Ptychodera flava TaxID=63121 RepID=UPI00396A2B03